MNSNEMKLMKKSEKSNSHHPLCDKGTIRKALLSILILGLMGSCATQTKSILLGSAIGSVAGVGLGGITKSQHQVVLGGVGAGIGALSGKLIYDYGESKRDEGEKLSVAKINHIVFGREDDVYVYPKIGKRTVPTHVTNGKRIEKHDEYYIEQPGHFKDGVEFDNGGDNE